MNVPVLETARLRLRGHRLGDFPDRHKLWSDPEVVRFISGTPMSEMVAWGGMLTLVGHWELLGFGYWVVEEKATGRFIGEIGFADFKREIVPSIAGVPELGWALVPSAHGKGYATEGARAAMEWSDSHFPARRRVCLISPDNVASIRVAEKLGFHEEVRTTFRDLPTILCARD